MILGIFIPGSVRQAHAQDSKVELENVVALVKFGEQITFVATIRSTIPVREASIIIRDLAHDLTHVEPLVVYQDGRTEFRYDTRQNLLRPFSPLSWYYRFILADGSLQQSEVFSDRYEDTRFDWQSLESGMLRIHWYGGNQEFGRAVLNTAEAGLGAVKRLVPVELDAPVDFYIYASLGDLRGTLVPGSQEWVAGHADPTLGVVMVAVEPGVTQDATMQQRIPHELAHVMMYHAVGDRYRNLPVWLSEGTAGLAELVTNPGYEPVLKDAIARNDWIPMKSVCNTFPQDTDRAFLAYAESRAFVKYLYETQGPSDMLNLTLAYTNGANCEDGLEHVLGDSLDELEEKWHQSLTGQVDYSFNGLQKIVPYLILLGLILIVPIVSVVSATRRKGDANG